MATWFKQLKTKYWDGEPYKNLPNSGFVIIGVRTPWARQFWKEHRAEIKKGCWGVFFVIIGASPTVASGIRCLDAGACRGQNGRGLFLQRRGLFPLSRQLLFNRRMFLNRGINLFGVLISKPFHLFLKRFVHFILQKTFYLLVAAG